MTFHCPDDATLTLEHLYLLDKPFEADTRFPGIIYKQEVSNGISRENTTFLFTFLLRIQHFLNIIDF